MTIVDPFGGVRSVIAGGAAPADGATVNRKPAATAATRAARVIEIGIGADVSRSP
jgi:hypothetical protein